MFTPAKPQNYLLSQVHQPFFISGIFFALAAMIVFLFSYKGLLTLQIDSTAFHSYSLLYLVFTQFFAGFILTTFPRFCQTEAVEKSYYLRTWFIQQAGAFLFLLGAVVSLYVLYAGLFLLLVANAAVVYKLQRIYSGGQTPVMSDQTWILTGFYFGLFAHLLYIASFLDVPVNAAPVAMNLYLVYVTFAVGQRMVPFFSHAARGSDPYFAPVVLGGLVVKTLGIYVDYVFVEAIADIALGLYIAAEIRSWKLPFRNSAPILKILHISLYWLVVSLVLGGAVRSVEVLFDMNFMKLDVHMLALGFVTTMLVGFGTRVTLGHSGQPPHADSITLKIFYLLQAVVLGRLFYSLAMGLESGMFWTFDLSVALWLLLFVFWGVRFGPVLVKGKKL